MTALANKSISRQPGPAAHSWCSPARRCELGVFRHVRILCNAGPESADQCTLCLFWARLHSVLSVSSFYQAHAKLARPVWRSLAQLPATQYRERGERTAPTCAEWDTLRQPSHHTLVTTSSLLTNVGIMRHSSSLSLFTFSSDEGSTARLIAPLCVII